MFSPLGFFSWPATLQALALVASPRLELQQKVHAFSFCECPIGMPWFQKEAPFQNLTPGSGEAFCFPQVVFL